MYSSKKVTWEEIQEFGRFAVVGLLTTLIYFFTANRLMLILALSPLLSNLLSFVISFIFSYVLQSIWSFKVKINKSRFVRFSIISSANFTLILVITLTFDYVGFSNEKAILFICLLLPIISYLFQKYWVFNDKTI
ncbi:GtrA family protein [Shewanella psychropiezotolerans]|uniref:GtrA family protein n=1 Tax=Shewanella psychropiezotolerans TaxID=2593655 RepID=A0ABX5WXY2_9GAMM|nr:GtrA family protein [Shewanella sp. YLB-07]QDO83963.1 GtrA family protein [Shewanella psychropiezotolerans]